MSAIDENPQLSEAKEDAKRAERRANLWHWVYRGGVGIALAALVVGTAAAAQGKQTSDCVNANLGTRSAPNDADRAAQDALNAAQDTYNKAQATAVASIESGANAVQALAVVSAASNSVAKAYDAYQTARKADDASRAANPLGKC